MNSLIKLQCNSIPDMDFSIGVSSDNFLSELHPFNCEDSVFGSRLLAAFNELITDSFPGLVYLSLCWIHVSRVLRDFMKGRESSIGLGKISISKVIWFKVTVIHISGSKVIKPLCSLHIRL
jgi:hypothetical protein